MQFWLGSWCYDKHQDKMQIWEEKAYSNLQIITHHLRKSR